jgi:hypothetical protein
MLFGFVGESCDTCIKKEIWVGFWVGHAILASNYKISFGFVGKSCNTHIKNKEFNWFMNNWCNTQNQYKKYISI